MSSGAIKFIVIGLIFSLGCGGGLALLAEGLDKRFKNVAEVEQALAIPFLGLALVDNVSPEALAQACREEGRYDFFFTTTPLRLRGATGAPAHPIAIF